MGKKLTIRARVYDTGDVTRPRTIILTGRYAQTLRELVKAGDKGVTALEISSWALRLSHYVFVLRNDPRYEINIETQLEEHEVDGMGAGQHGRYFLRTPVELISDYLQAAE